LKSLCKSNENRKIQTGIKHKKVLGKGAGILIIKKKAGIKKMKM